MKKNIIAAIIMCILSVFIIWLASGREENNDNQKATNVTDEKKQSDNVIEIWYSYDSYKKYLESAVKEFEKNNKTGYKVELKFISEPAYFDYINNESLEGRGPDLYVMGSEYIEKAYLLGILKQNENDDIFNATNFTKTAINAITYETQKYGMPLGFNAAVLAYNKEYVDGKIETFDDIKNYADNFNNGEDNSKDYSKIRNIFAWDLNDLLFNYGFVGKYIRIDDDSKNIDMCNENVLGAFDEYLQLIEYFSMSGDENYDEIIKKFADGQVVFTIGDTSIVKKVADKCEYEIVPITKFNDDYECGGLSYTDVLAVNPNSPDIAVAEALGEFISYEYAANMYEKSGIVSARKSVKYDDVHLNEFVEVYENAMTMYNFMETEDYFIVMNDAMKKIWGGKSAKEVMDELEKKYIESME